MTIRIEAAAAAVALVLAGCGGGSGETSDGGGGNAPSSGGSSPGPGSGGSRGDSGGGGSGGAPHQVTPCSALKGVGVWENITPPGTDLGAFGFGTVSIDPQDPATLFVGGDSGIGIRRSADCGATWTHVDTGALGADIDKGGTDPMVDPVDPKIVYTRSLYGTNGLFKSTNGGVDWTSILTPDIQALAPYGGFTSGFDMDPNDHEHLLVSWHAECTAPAKKACYGETSDGGKTWKMRDGEDSWAGGEGTFLNFLDSDTWLFSSSSNGLWRSPDQGKSWKAIAGAEIAHGNGMLYRAPNGSFFLGSATGVLYSPDGLTFTLVPSSGNLITGLTGDGTTIWASNAFPYNPGMHPDPFLPYFTAKIADPMHFTSFDSPKLTSGGVSLAYDKDHHLLYSANYWEGVYRVRVE